MTGTGRRPVTRRSGDTGGAGDVSQAIRADAARVLTSIALGYEVGVRVAAARDFGRLRTTDSGRWCSYAVGSGRPDGSAGSHRMCWLRL